MQFNRFQTLADILILMGLVVFGGFIIGGLGILVISIAFGMDIGAVLIASTDIGNPENIDILKIANLFTNFGAWVVSAFVLIKVRRYDVSVTWQLKLPKSRLVIPLLPVLFMALLSVSLFLVTVNSSIPIPESIRNLSSEANRKLMHNMLVMENTNQLIVNILLIGLAPALFEEIFFRGTLQRLLIHLFGDAHSGIFLTSFIFAAIHLNVMQFMPMLFLALVLGYVCYYTKSIWPSIILHFLNNSFAVLANYYEDKLEFAKRLADDNYNPPAIITILSFVLIGAFFYWLINFNKKQAALNHE